MKTMLQIPNIQYKTETAEDFLQKTLKSNTFIIRAIYHKA